MKNRRIEKNRTKGRASNTMLHWTKEEDAALLIGMKRYGSDLFHLSLLIPTRSKGSIMTRIWALRKSVRRRAVTLSNKEKKALYVDMRDYEKWESSEVDCLIKVCQEVGGKPDLVAKHFPHKSFK